MNKVICGRELNKKNGDKNFNREINRMPLKIS